MDFFEGQLADLMKDRANRETLSAKALETANTRLEAAEAALAGMENTPEASRDEEATAGGCPKVSKRAGRSNSE